MSDDLIRENKELREHLATVMANARYNEKRMHRFHEQELRLLSAGGLVELLQRLLEGHRQAFGLATVTLSLVDPEYEIQRLLQTLGHDHTFPELRFLDAEAELLAFFAEEPAPRLGRFSPLRHGHLFHLGCQPASVAIVPLKRHDNLIGTLNLGSQEVDRFSENSATDFLERLGAVAAIGLENAINHERLKYIGLIDGLTGVHNRRYFDRRLTEEVERTQRSEQPISCLFLDVDHFKQVNDAYGHQVGDQVLKEVAARIKAQLRLSDVLGRYGGEEFAILLIQTDPDKALNIAERIRASIAAKPFRLGDDRELAITISVGAATLLPHGRGGELDSVAASLVAQADQAMYQAKQRGRNRVVQAPPEGEDWGAGTGLETNPPGPIGRLPS